tara:strand:- start:245 stop:379 length:135 start_codon:yes stop_codon:yes gene_type:complete
MYPYAEEIKSSIKAFFLAWMLIITPITMFTTVYTAMNPASTQSE